MRYESLDISHRGQTLVVQWDNRKIPRSSLMTVFVAGFWFVWTSVMVFVTLSLITGGGLSWSSAAWLVLGYAVVALLPLAWALRRTVERVEIDDARYRHHFVDLPWWPPIQWDARDITKVTFGHCDDESNATLSVWCGVKRDLIATWATDEFRQRLFEEIRRHLARIGSDIPVVNLDAGPGVAP